MAARSCLFALALAPYLAAAACPNASLEVRYGDGKLPYSSLDATPIVWVGPECLGVFTGSPAILQVGSEWLCAHDFFGTTSFNRSKPVLVSADNGRTWRLRATVKGMYWSNLFAGPSGTGDIYMLGVNGDDTHKVTPPNTKPLKGGPAVISKSSDAGRTWTTPSVIFQGSFQTGPTPTVLHDGTFFRSMEVSVDPAERDSHGVEAFVMWAAADADLLDAASWHRSSGIAAPAGPGNATALGWQEGSVVVSPAGDEIWNILRVNHQEIPGFYNKAAATVLDVATKRLVFKQWIDGPFSESKFLIRQDPNASTPTTYYSLSTTITQDNARRGEVGARNTLVLATSNDLLRWRVCKTVLHDDTGLTAADSARLTGFEYPDWTFSGNDIVAAVRTAYRGAPNGGSSNFEMWLKVEDYRGACNQ